jgi:hypothetical protein
MKKLARWAARFGSLPSVTYRVIGFSRVGALLVCAIVMMLVFSFSFAFADGATVAAPLGDGVTGGLISLWGPLLGVVVALVTFFDRLAKVIPNSTTSTILNAIRIVATVLGAKVQDKQ